MKIIFAALASLAILAAAALAVFLLAGWNTAQQAGLALFAASLAAFLLGGGAALDWLQRAALTPGEDGQARGIRDLVRALAAERAWSLALAAAGVVGLVIGSIAWMAG